MGVLRVQVRVNKGIVHWWDFNRITNLLINMVFSMKQLSWNLLAKVFSLVMLNKVSVIMVM